MFHFTIRAAKHSDLNAVCKISQKVLSSALPFDELEKLYVNIIEDIEQIIMVAEHSGHVTGFIHAKRASDLTFGTYTEIVEIAMLPYYQRHGASKSLIFAVEKWSSQMVASNIKCILKSENEAVKALLLSCGYVETGLGAFEKTIV